MYVLMLATFEPQKDPGHIYYDLVHLRINNNNIS